MKIVHGVKSIGSGSRSVLTVGSFDGVHLGHRALIEQVLLRSQQTGAPAVVMTFEPHPVQLLYPERGLKRLFDFDDQRRELAALGVDVLVIEPFSREFSQLSPARYLAEWIYKPFHPELLVVGHDFTFGANKTGTIDVLREQASSFGFDVVVVAPVLVDSLPVSSSRIRKALADTDVRFASRMLGRRFYIEGIVEKGAGRGRTIGVPTANVRSSSETTPAGGVYAALAVIRGQKWVAAVNIGRNPTFADGHTESTTIEAHLVDFYGLEGGSGSTDLYGERLRLEFVERIRQERKFESAEALVTRIREDIKVAREIVAPEMGRMGAR